MLDPPPPVPGVDSLSQYAQVSLVGHRIAFGIGLCHRAGPKSGAATRVIAQLPAFRHLTSKDYRNKVSELIREIEDEAEAKRGGNTGALPKR